MKFNKNQRNGLAVILDNMGTATIIALIVGIFIESKITLLPAIALLFLAVVSIGTALLLRSRSSDE